MITVDGQTPAPFDSHEAAPNITVHEGEVEDWTIENRSREMHAPYSPGPLHAQAMERRTRR